MAVSLEPLFSSRGAIELPAERSWRKNAVAGALLDRVSAVLLHSLDNRSALLGISRSADAVLDGRRSRDGVHRDLPPTLHGLAVDR